MTGTDNETRRLLGEALGRMLERDYPFAQREAVRHGERASVGLWDKLGGLGIFGLDDAEDEPGEQLVNIGLVAELTGGALVLEPVVPALIGARLIARAAGAEHPLMAALKSGDAIAVAAPSTVEAGSRLACRSTSDRWILSGSENVVPGGPDADIVLVAANADGGSQMLIAVPTDRKGIRRKDYQLFDGRAASDVTFDNVAISADEIVVRGGDLVTLLEVHAAEAALLNACDALGAMKACDAMTLEYLKTREQFGRPLGDFQALQHRKVDACADLDLASAIVEQALAAADTMAKADWQRLAWAAVGRAALSARHIAEESVQMHGGMGLTEEYPVSHYFARLTVFELLYRHDDAVDRFAEAMDDV